MEDSEKRKMNEAGFDWVLTEEDKSKIMRERAKKLSARSKTEEAGEEKLEIVEFVLSGEIYGIESVHIREAYPLKNFTPIPCTPAFVLGVINVRGEVLSIVDIGRFFDLPRKGITDLNKVIVLGSGDMEFGILADEVLGVSLIPLKDIQESLPTLTGIRAEYLKGVTNDRVTVLDAGKILLDKNLIVHQEVSG
jgi:purine-binding chemotaxis protein CheW